MLTVKAYAKVNLHLHVGPRRSDGYHSIQTIFQQISLADTLRLSRQEQGVRLTVEPKGLTHGADNLVVQALELLRTELKINFGFKAHLIKRIPLGAGLGGGSSDAAAALLAGWRVFKGKKGTPAPLPKKIPPVLFSLARKLGADVPYFLRGGTAWGEGIGEKLSLISGCQKRWMVLIFPRIHVSTKTAYELLDDHRKKHPEDVDYQQTSKKEEVLRYLRGMKRPAFIYPHGPYNSFFPVIIAHYPEVAEARQELSRLGCAPVMMSGSGSTVFGFVKDQKEGRYVLQELSDRPWDVFVAHTIH